MTRTRRSIPCDWADREDAPESEAEQRYRARHGYTRPEVVYAGSRATVDPATVPLDAAARRRQAQVRALLKGTL